MINTAAHTNATDIAVGQDGTVILGAHRSGVSAFTFDNPSFTHLARYDRTGLTVHTVALGADGTVFCAANDKGLQAFALADTGFVYIDKILTPEDGGMDFAQDVTQGPDGTLFLANYGDGLRAHTFDGTHFTRTAHAKDGQYATSVATGEDGTIFVGMGVEGLRAYTCKDTSFTKTAEIDDASSGYAYGLCVGPDSTIFVANGGNGLRAYTYDGSAFVLTAHVDDGGDALDCAVTPDGTVFLANGSDGVRAYTYDGSSFTNTAHTITSLYCEGIAVAPDGTVLAASSGIGIIAYHYFQGSAYTLTVNSGTGSGEYAPETRVRITAYPPPVLRVFDRWTGDTGCVEDVAACTTMVTMPSHDIQVSATYRYEGVGVDGESSLSMTTTFPYVSVRGDRLILRTPKGAPACVRIFDIHGRTLWARTVYTKTMVNVNSLGRTGNAVYIMEYIQGKNREKVKIVAPR
jgi:hypothetical protein